MDTEVTVVRLTARNEQQTPEAKWGKKRFSPARFRWNMAPTTPRFHTSSLQNWETILFCCSELRHFVRSALRKSYTRLHLKCKAAGAFRKWISLSRGTVGIRHPKAHKSHSLRRTDVECYLKETVLREMCSNPNLYLLFCLGALFHIPLMSFYTQVPNQKGRS